MALWSQRFNKAIRLTYHAKAHMEERDITESILLGLIEDGKVKFKDDNHCWIFKDYPDRKDNLRWIQVISATGIKFLMLIPVNS